MPDILTPDEAAMTIPFVESQVAYYRQHLHHGSYTQRETVAALWRRFQAVLRELQRRQVPSDYTV